MKFTRGRVMVMCRPLSSDHPDELAAMLRPLGGEVTVTQGGAFSSDAIQLNFEHLWMQCADEVLPRIWRVAASPTRAAIWFPSRPGPPMSFQGKEVGMTELGLCPLRKEEIWHRITGPSGWSSMSLPVENWASISAIAESDPASATVGGVLRPRDAEMGRLRRLHVSISRLARDAPELLNNSEVARGVEQSLVQALIECLQPVAGLAVPRHSRAKLMRRIRDSLEAAGEASVFLPELCAQLGLSSRSLRAICHEYVGVGPKRFLYLRRMHLARQALRARERGNQRVTEIATRFGFWELGRFAVEYKALFGESPSQTRPLATRPATT